MNEPISDAQLVTAFVAGDRAALAGLYDRFADSIFDTAAAMLSDRHEAADVVQDVFVIAAEKLAQLRDPARCKAWLFAIMRNEVYRRSKRRRRSVPTDFTAPGLDVAAPAEAGAEGEGVEYAELAELVRGAAAGLDERDQLVLELSVRQGLQGADLAAALGVDPQQSYSMVHRMRERAERSLGAYCVARRGRRDCPELNDILRGWDGTFNVLVRKRVARHVEACERCERNRRQLAPLVLFGAAPALAAPADLRDRVLQHVEIAGAPPRDYGFDGAGFPRHLRPQRRRSWWVAPIAAGLVLLLGGAGLWAATRGGGDSIADASADGVASATTTSLDSITPETTTDTTKPDTTTTMVTSTTVAPTSTVDAGVLPPIASTTALNTTLAPATTTAPTTTLVTTTTRPAPPTTAPPPPPPPGIIEVSSGLVDLGATATSGGFTIANPGGTTYTWALGGPASFGVSPSGGTLAPGASQPITVTFARAGAPEATYESTYQITAPGLAAASVTVRARVEVDPVVTWAPPPNNPPSFFQTCGQVLVLKFDAADDSPIASARLDWVAPGGATGSAAATFIGGRWSASVVIPRGNPNTTWSFTALATDNRGNTGSSSAIPVLVGC